MTPEELHQIEVWLGPDGTRIDALMRADGIIARTRWGGGNIKAKTAAVLREKIADGLLSYANEQERLSKPRIVAINPVDTKR